MRLRWRACWELIPCLKTRGSRWFPTLRYRFCRCPGTDASRKDLLAVVGFLEKYPDVEQVTVLSDAELRALLEPWLGNNVDVEMLPIPKLLDVKIRKQEF